MNSITPVIVPKETISDDLYMVAELCFNNGDEVTKGDVIGYLETSKSTIELESPASGYIFFNVEEGQEVIVGAIYAVISIDPIFPSNYFKKLQKETRQEESDKSDINYNIRISKAAKKLIQEHNIDLSVFQEKKIINSENVKQFLQIKTNRKVNIETSDNSIIIIGGGGHTKMCIDILHQLKSYKFIGIVSESIEIGAQILGVQILGTENDLEELYKNGISDAIVGFGALENPIIRKKKYNKLKKIGFTLPNLIHPSAILEPSVTLGDGNQIMAGAIVGSDVKICNNCIINSGSIISHDSILMDNVHITPGAILAGNVKVGRNTIVGMGATIYLSVTIGSNVVINNGANVFNDVPDGTIVKK